MSRTPGEQANLDLVLGMFAEVLNPMDSGAAPRFISPDYIQHNQAVEPGREAHRAVQLESTRRQAQLWVDVPTHPTAVIELDGERVGTGSASRELDAGSHEVRVSRSDPNLEPWARTLELEWNERLRLDVSLEDPPEPSLDVGAIAGVTAGILGAAAIGVLVGILATELAPRPNGGTTGVVLTLDPLPTR